MRAVAKQDEQALGKGVIFPKATAVAVVSLVLPVRMELNATVAADAAVGRGADIPRVCLPCFAKATQGLAAPGATNDRRCRGYAGRLIQSCDFARQCARTLTPGH